LALNTSIGNFSRNLKEIVIPNVSVRVGHRDGLCSATPQWCDVEGWPAGEDGTTGDSNISINEYDSYLK
jgi:hypothetical protein